MIFTHDKDAVLDYAWDWTAWLGTGETVTAAVVTVPTGLTKSQTETFTAGGVVTVWLTGGTVGVGYRPTCRITTNKGRTDERSFLLRVADR